MRYLIYIVFISFFIFINAGCGNNKSAKKSNPKACFYQNIADFGSVSSNDAPITCDMLKKWEHECGYNSELEKAESESASLEDDNTVVASTTTTTAALAHSAKPPRLSFNGNNGSPFNHISLVFIATEDIQTIEKVVVNRGNCQANLFGNEGKDNVLKFGQKVSYVTTCTADRILEVQATVNGTVHTWTTSKN